MGRLALKTPPAGWEDIEPTLSRLDMKMREVENESHEGKRVVETTWPIFQLHHQKSRYVYELYYKKQAISKELYDYCVANKIIDGALIAKWKKPGYERLCCLRCIQAKDTNFGTMCICRVPRKDLDEDKVIACVHCGCRGC